MKILSLVLCLALLAFGQNASDTPSPTITAPTTAPLTPAPTTKTPDTPTPTTITPSPPSTPVPTTSTPSPPPTTTPPTISPTTTIPTTIPPTPTTTNAPPKTTAATTATATTTPPSTTQATPSPTSSPTPSPTPTPTPTSTESTLPPNTPSPEIEFPASTTKSLERAIVTPAPSLRQEESQSNSGTVWIILGSVVGVLLAGILFVFMVKRSKKEEGHDDDVISNYGGQHSSPNISFNQLPHSQSFDQRSIPAVVSPAPLHEVAITDRSRVVEEEEQYFSDTDIPRQSYASSTDDDRRHTDSARSPNLWQSALTSTPRGGATAFESDAFHSTLSDSYSIAPSFSSDEQSESFVSKYSSTYDVGSTTHQI